MLRRSLLVLLLAFFSIAHAQIAPAPTTDQLHQWLQAATRRSNLIDEGAPPFHLVATFELFQEGRSMGKGSLELLWRDPLSYKETIVLPDHAQKPLVAVDNGNTEWRTGESGNVPFPVYQMEGLVLSPIPAADIQTKRLALDSQYLGLKDIDCIAREPEIPETPNDLLIARTTYCLARGNHIPRYVDTPLNYAFSLNDIVPFGNKFIARSFKITGVKSPAPIIQLHVDKLETPADFSALDAPAPSDARVYKAHTLHNPNSDETNILMPGQMLSRPSLRSIAPSIFDADLFGTAEFLLHIDTSGAVSDAEIVHSDNAAQNPMLLSWVRRFRFRAGYQGNRLAPFTTHYTFNFSEKDRDAR